MTRNAAGSCRQFVIIFRLQTEHELRADKSASVSIHCNHQLLGVVMMPAELWLDHLAWQCQHCDSCWYSHIIQKLLIRYTSRKSWHLQGERIARKRSPAKRSNALMRHSVTWRIGAHGEVKLVRSEAEDRWHELRRFCDCCREQWSRVGIDDADDRNAWKL